MTMHNFMYSYGSNVVQIGTAIIINNFHLASAFSLQLTKVVFGVLHPDRISILAKFCKPSEYSNYLNTVYLASF